MEKVLLELVRFYSRFVKNEESTFIKPENEGSKTSELFFRVLNNVERSDSDKAYMMLRKGLIHKLSKYILILDLEKLYKSSYSVTFFQILKDSIKARILLSIGFYQGGLYFGKKTLEKAVQMEMWDVVLSLSMALTNYYSIRDERKKFEYYNQLVIDGIEAQRRDLLLKQYLNKWNLLFSKKRQASSTELEELKEDVEKAADLIKGSNSVTMHHFYCRLQLIYYDAMMDYEKVIAVCESARSFIQENSSISDKNRLAIYHGVQMYCYLNLKDFKNAKVYANELDYYFPEGSLNWFIFMEYYYVLSIQTANYKHAFDLITRVTDSPAFGQLRGVRNQVWKLLAGYMQFLISSQIWSQAGSSEGVKEFRLNKFLNEVISLGGDKTGIQVSVLILQILFLMVQGRYEEIIDRRDALRRYVYRYLYSKENERSRIFLTMLLRMIECDFSYAMTKQKTQRLLKSLQDQQMNYQANIGGNEIVDYEVLWNWALNAMKKGWSGAVSRTEGTAA